MARTRNIKPGFFLNEELAEIEPLGRLLFAGLWTIADREGRIEDRPKRIKAELLPYDDCDVDRLLDSLHENGFIVRYKVNGESYLEVKNFTKHQHIVGTEAKSIIPPPACDNAEVKQVCNELENFSNKVEKKSNKLEEIAPESCSLNLESLSSNPKSLNLNPSVCVTDVTHTTRARAGDEPVEKPVEKAVEKMWEKRFKEFWEAYPRKTGKGAAEKAYKKINPSKELHETMIRAVRSAALSKQWKKDGGQFIPNPATWLNQKRWEDEIPPETIYSEKADIADRAISMLESLEDNKNDEGSRCC
jgi:hypothetical protein